MTTNHTFRGHRTADGTAVVTMDGGPLSPARSMKVRNHSPTGFEWGYCGSGPAQLALAILLEVMTEIEAVTWHQDFKRQFVAAWQDKWIVSEHAIALWVCEECKKDLDARK